MKCSKHIFPAVISRAAARGRGARKRRAVYLHVLFIRNMQVCAALVARRFDGLEHGRILHGVQHDLPFTGAHQVHNAATALTVLDVLREKHANITDEALQKGFASAYIPARMEILSQKPLVLLDGGHNPGCEHDVAALFDDACFLERDLRVGIA